MKFGYLHNTINDLMKIIRKDFVNIHFIQHFGMNLHLKIQFVDKVLKFVCYVHMKTTVIVINQNYKKKYHSNIIQRDHCLCAYEDDEGDSNIDI